MAGQPAEEPGEIAVALSRHVAGTPARLLPEAVSRKTVQHVLDTVAAMVSGARLKVGRLALAYAEAEGGKAEATLIGSSVRVPCTLAAFANGLSAHADETDDSHLAGRFHPGCAIVPSALAVAEARGATGADLLRAVALGYDIGARAVMALGLKRPDTARHSSHSIGSLFGATAASAALLRLDERQVRHAFSYAVQQTSGVPFWQRDTEHMEKAFDFAGMGARNGVTAARLVAAGFSAVDDPFAGRHSFFTAFGEAPDPERLVEDLGSRHEILRASIKKWCVGSPIQAVLDATTRLIRGHRLAAADVAAVTVTMPDDRIHIVDGRSMPSVCVQHLVAVALIDGTVTFATAHDEARMADPSVLALRRRVTLVPSADLTQARPARQAIVEIETQDGRTLRHHARAVRGTPDDPMTLEEVVAKALDLMEPVLGAPAAGQVIDAVLALETAPTVETLAGSLGRA